METQPLHVGFDTADNASQYGRDSNMGGNFATGDGDPDEDTRENYVDGPIATRNRTSDGFARVRNSGEKREEQAGLNEALVRMKRKTYIRDASITGVFVLSW